MKVLCRVLALMAIITAMCCHEARAQDSTGLYNKIFHFPDRLFKKVNDKTADINNKLTRQTEKYLSRLSKEEGKLKKKLAQKDSTAASKLFDNSQQEYAALEAKLKNLSGNVAGIRDKYIPHLDTLKTAFGFLSQADGMIKSVPGTPSKITEAMGKLDGLQGKFNQAEEVKQFIQARKQLLQEQLVKYGLSSNLQAYQKQVYYYQAQVDEYKKMFDDPSKLEAKALDVISKTQAFQTFFLKNSQLANMFKLPSGSQTPSIETLAGLQTRESFEQSVKQKFGSIPDAQKMMQGQMQNAKQQLNILKDKLSKATASGSPVDMPNFKPNGQKTKTFLKRLEFGSNLQTVKSNWFFPSTTDIGLSLGYKLNSKSTVGIGGSYKIGWGRDIRHISISSQGVGLRSFLDYKIKGNFWMSGGVEMNYRSQFSQFKVLQDYSAWQKSALIGISKKYQVSKRVKGNAQLLYDGLWKQQIPRTQPIIFRTGYTL